MTLQSLTERIQTLVGTDSGLDASFKFATEDGIVAINAKQVPNIVTNEDIDTDCTMEISLKNAEDLLNGELNPMMGYMMGKFKIKGDMGVAMKISQAMGNS
ncbi:MAG: sterol-binding protein [Runella slithyformis]|jgi:putative sterol carrier protein|nr:MAG: sterol-binding protein [Runella slithyformis]TAG23165.1 MAG: sterol-binding protein [Cytophagales bacterium]TAG39781.1 MAG: sterol-binding protein [Cytophagia bacterium]TAF78790.1 MAG: sterol-binding protein [Runella slithyformis]TAG47795.1 MAG: sterol-binding protein [Runella slithyformis]